MENKEDFDISAYGVDAEFYVTAGAEPDEDGKYGDYIVSFGDWLAVQESGYQFNCVYGELPSSDDDDEDDEDAEAEREEYIASEKRRLWAEYVVPYIIKGNQISIKQIDFEETRPNEASDPDEPYGRTMDALRSVVMMSQSGEESDAEDGLFLFTFDKDEYFDNDGFAVDDGKLVCYKGTAAEVSIPKSVKTIGGYAFNGCTSLVKLSIPKAVTEIRGGAFEGCTALREIRYGGTQAEWFMLNAFSGLSENVTVHCSDGDFVPPRQDGDRVCHSRQRDGNRKLCVLRLHVAREGHYPRERDGNKQHGVRGLRRAQGSALRRHADAVVHAQRLPAGSCGYRRPLFGRGHTGGGECRG